MYASLLRVQGTPPALEACFGHELCAGLIDKEKSLAEIASEEVGRTALLCVHQTFRQLHVLDCSARWRRSVGSM